MIIGLRVHRALADLGICIAPELAADERPGRAITPWAGIAIILVLALALASAGQTVTWAVNEALPRREVQP